MSKAKDYTNAQEIFKDMIGKKIVDIQHEVGDKLRISLDSGQTFEIVSHPSYLPTIQEV